MLTGKRRHGTSTVGVKLIVYCSQSVVRSRRLLRDNDRRSTDQSNTWIDDEEDGRSKVDDPENGKEDDEICGSRRSTEMMADVMADGNASGDHANMPMGRESEAWHGDVSEVNVTEGGIKDGGWITVEKRKRMSAHS